MIKNGRKDVKEKIQLPNKNKLRICSGVTLGVVLMRYLGAFLAQEERLGKILRSLR